MMSYERLHTMQEDNDLLDECEVPVVEDTEEWDLYDAGAEEKDTLEEEGDIFTVTVKILKIIVYLCTFFIILACGVISKASLLFLTSAISHNTRFTPCSTENVGIDKNYSIQLSSAERYLWIWCLFFALLVPEVLSFIRSIRICLFKRYERPKISSFVAVFVMETFHCVGEILLVFFAFAEMSVLEAVALSNAFSIIPSLLNVFKNWPSQKSLPSNLNKLLCVSSFIGQLSFIAWVALKNSTAQTLSSSCGVVAVIFISMSWWENFVGVNFPQSIIRLKTDIERSRHFIYVFVTPWKVALMFLCILLYLFQASDDVVNFLSGLNKGFQVHNVTAALITDSDIPEIFQPLEVITLHYEKSEPYLPVIIATIHVIASYLCYSCGKFVCKICIQKFSFAFPVLLTAPVTMILLYSLCNKRTENECALQNYISPYLFWMCPADSADDFLSYTAPFWILWLLSQIWVTIYLWNPHMERMASTNKLFVNPMYNTTHVDQSLALNRRNDEQSQTEEKAKESPNPETEDVNNFPRIFACATMWHETPDEMEQLLKSIMRLDVHQCFQKTIEDKLEIKNPDYYEIEAHIFFDDAFVVSGEDDEKKMTINSFVKDFIESVNVAASKVYKQCKILKPPIKVPTPYGGRLIWGLSGGNALVVHLKNKTLIRHKKRWSQVMYMHYLLRYHLEFLSKECKTSSSALLKNSFILALDGDIDFKPKAVQLLVDLMNRNKKLGAACGRIHPVGTGMMVYYQKFEYAIGHWLQKSTEHMIGCVLCSPGCFSLFRAEALMKKGTIKTYAKKSSKAEEYVQFDQGEDRWLCTLLLQRGYRVEYSAASDAYTHCPESFKEFYTQRRRWAPSTMANIMDLLVNYKKTVECNDNISRPYIAYQVLLMIGTILGPGTIFLMIVGAMVSAFNISNWQSFGINLVPIIFFILICFYAKNDTQILIAQVLSSLYALLMMAVLVGISLQMVVDGITSPSAIFILAMTASFLVAALAHPQEFWCVAHGLIYFMSIPSMYLLLALYSFANLHVVSWGTREVQTKKTEKQLEEERKRAEIAVQKPAAKSGIMSWMNVFSDRGATQEEGGFSFGLANLFRCLCCTYPKPDPAAISLLRVEGHLKEMTQQMQKFQSQMDIAPNRTHGFRKRWSVSGLAESNFPPETEVMDKENGDVAAYDEENNEDGEEHTYNQLDHNEHWLTESVLNKCSTKRLYEQENTFWNELIKKYLLPLEDDPQEQAKISTQLLDLRNKVVFGVLMLNSLFILIVSLLQMQKDTLHVDWPLNGKPNITYFARLQEIRIEMEYLHLEPINLVLVFFFSLILVIQFIAMLFHRLETLSHILASTNLIDSQDKDTDTINFSELAHLLQQQGLRDDDEVNLAVGNDEADAPCRENENDFPTNVLPERDTLSVGGEMISRQVRFRSLNISMEQDLQKLLEKDIKLAHKVRRMSRNPAVLEDLHRRTSIHALGATPTFSRSQTPLESCWAGSRMGTPRIGINRRSFYCPDSEETESVNSIQMVNFPPPPETSWPIRSSAANADTNFVRSASVKRNSGKIREQEDSQTMAENAV